MISYILMAARQTSTDFVREGEAPAEPERLGSAGASPSPKYAGGSRKAPSLVDRVVDSISRLVLDRPMAPAAPLPAEAELARRYHVSRTVIREAMRLLSDRGLIEVVHGKRPRVRGPAPAVAARSIDTLIRRGGASLRQLAEVRIPLESEIAALAAKRRSAADLAALRQCLAAQAAAKSLNQQTAQDVRFHALLARATKNVIFDLMLRTVSDLLEASRRRTLGRMGNRRALRHHRRILDAVVARSPAQARAAMIHHLRAALADLNGQARSHRSIQ